MQVDIIIIIDGERLPAVLVELHLECLGRFVVFNSVKMFLIGVIVNFYTYT